MQSQILPSREALAKRIALQFSYGQNLIHLVAGSGYGKSYLLEHFVTDHYESFNKAYVHAKASSQDADIQTYLLEHSFSYPLIDVSLSLRENFLRLLQEQGERELLWVIDNAKHLSEELLAELEWLAQHAPCTLYILCASSQSGLLSSAIDIHLEPLPYAESLRLLSYFYANLPHREDPVFAEFLKECNGNPALLLQWQQREQQMPKVERKRQKGIWLILGSVLLVIVLLGALYQYQQPQASKLLPESSLEPQLVQITQAADSDVNVDTSAYSPQEVEDVSPEPNEVQLILPDSELSGSPEQALPAADVVDTSKQAEAVIDKTKQELAVLELASEKDSETLLLTQPEAQVEPDSTPAFDHAWYLAQSDEQWLWQLTIMSKEQQIEDFIKRFDVAEYTKHYFRADKGWHVLTWSVLGDRESIQQQRDEITSKIPGVEPYAKQISQIKAEINSQPATQMR